MSYRFLLERWRSDDFGEHLDRWKRLRRQGWDITALYEFAGHDVIVLGLLELEQEHEPEPDRLGRLELPLEV